MLIRYFSPTRNTLCVFRVYTRWFLVHGYLVDTCREILHEGISTLRCSLKYLADHAKYVFTKSIFIVTWQYIPIVFDQSLRPGFARRVTCVQIVFKERFSIRKYLLQSILRRSMSEEVNDFWSFSFFIYLRYVSTKTGSVGNETSTFDFI